MNHKDRTPRFSIVRFFFSSLALLGLLAVLSGCASSTDASTQAEAPANLVEAVFQGDVTTVKQMLDRGDSPAVYGDGKWHPLHYTASPEDEGDRGHDLEIARLLVEAGADINATTESGYTALHLAVVNERVELREYLLDIGAEVNTALESERTPLSGAVAVGDLEAVESLLAAGADAELLNAGYYAGFCPLHFAAQADPKGDRKDDAEIVRLTVDGGARVDCQGEGKATALYMATVNNRLEVMAALLEGGANPELSTKNWWNPLGVAIYQGDIRAVELLLSHGADLQGVSVDGWRAMHHTVNKPGEGNREQDSKIADLLLDAGATVNDRTVRGKTVLHQAVTHGRHDRIAELLSQGANVNTNNDYGHTPLMTAISMGDVEMVETLLEAGANPDRPMASLGYTSLHHIAHDSGGTPADDEKIVRLLIDHGADVNAESKSGNTPVMLMTWNDREDLVDILVEAGAEPPEEDDCGCT